MTSMIADLRNQIKALTTENAQSTSNEESRALKQLVESLRREKETLEKSLENASRPNAEAAAHDSVVVGVMSLCRCR